MTNFVSHFFQRTENKALRGLKISLKDLKDFYKLLSKKNRDAAEYEINNWNRSSLNDSEWENLKTEIRDAYRVRVLINKIGGGSVSGDSESVFEPENFPAEVSSVSLETGFVFHALAQKFARNNAVIKLDFGRVSPWNFSIIPGFETYNDSQMSVSGAESAWVSSLATDAISFLDNKKRDFIFIHNQGIYDIFFIFCHIPNNIFYYVQNAEFCRDETV